jgi:hypothetical protein
MSRIPTDSEILQAIYDRHADSLEHFDRNLADRESKIMVQIDYAAIWARTRGQPKHRVRPTLLPSRAETRL